MRNLKESHLSTSSMLLIKKVLSDAQINDVRFLKVCLCDPIHIRLIWKHIISKKLFMGYISFKIYRYISHNLKFKIYLCTIYINAFH